MEVVELLVVVRFAEYQIVVRYVVAAAFVNVVVYIFVIVAIVPTSCSSHER